MTSAINILVLALLHFTSQVAALIKKCAWLILVIVQRLLIRVKCNITINWCFCLYLDVFLFLSSFSLLVVIVVHLHVIDPIEPFLYTYCCTTHKPYERWLILVKHVCVVYCHLLWWKIRKLVHISKVWILW